ncbi:AAA family ATPase [Candidatus Falkowbacteria bacterium RIFOXYB2_FULL_47_14]|uniref:AAA family ATPase n=1 Tax=Candidatus Falkowbacteria bacterium RIFOXYA2_FULL_47_19 TaxID=1797994 RepID=A0A1F5SMM5_9BACT|nr:MAG: AAA family ATPase [Candidatus Falkowbacteria bacterium RIFOXYA2_FULL_47_19]OGF36036.1 MAG: AAA family ATPase [Candidatus Falkowbacteria bacterium RIFOXYC2_FULL_46_15]OGF43426.1 MAG: AAA family ATPase [Candidatus Falkowbacteria bacterium RIFOXYB2_FULL_47_14]
MTENTQKTEYAPLADRMRPEKLEDFLGQEEVVGAGKMLRRAIEADRLPSMIFWGPPGTGKTTLASIIARQTRAEFLRISAVTSGMKELRQIMSEAKANKIEDKKTILFIDEIHRWNKSQQDALLPHVENGLIVLIGATTENPSFEVRGALLSRCRVFVLQRLDEIHIAVIIKKALLDKERGLGGSNVKIGEKEIKLLSGMANGDARTALNILEYASTISDTITADEIKEAFQKSHLLYDKDGEEHYNIISALHKSMRGSDADAALYWLARMLEAGEDPLYVARRLVRFASEDIGLANSRALEQAVSAYNACHFMGMPECNVVLAQAVVYMAKCKKSNDLYIAYGKAARDVKEHGNLPVPIHIRNAPTALMKELGYGKDYKYSPDHGYREKQEYLPEKIKGRKYLRS